MGTSWERYPIPSEAGSPSNHVETQAALPADSPHTRPAAEARRYTSGKSQRPFLVGWAVLAYADGWLSTQSGQSGKGCMCVHSVSDGAA